MRGVKYTLNLSAFAKPLSTEAKYWIGFLLADGCIVEHQGYPCIKLGLAATDAEHVRKFAKFVGIDEKFVAEYDRENAFGKSRLAVLVFTGRELVPQLAEYGVIPRKTQTAYVHTELAQDSDFWRGMIDGDGSLSFSPANQPIPWLQFCGNHSTVNSFTEFLLLRVGRKPAIVPTNNIFKTGLAGRRAQLVINEIYYENCCPVLNRKKIIAQQCAAWKFRENFKEIRKKAKLEKAVVEC